MLIGKGTVTQIFGLSHVLANPVMDHGSPVKMASQLFRLPICGIISMFSFYFCIYTYYIFKLYITNAKTRINHLHVMFTRMLPKYLKLQAPKCFRQRGGDAGSDLSKAP